jgi:hypothetical protein
MLFDTVQLFSLNFGAQPFCHFLNGNQGADDLMSLTSETLPKVVSLNVNLRSESTYSASALACGP